MKRSRPVPIWIDNDVEVFETVTVEVTQSGREHVQRRPGDKVVPDDGANAGAAQDAE